jgi:hypothetical protein
MKKYTISEILKADDIFQEGMQTRYAKKIYNKK